MMKNEPRKVKGPTQVTQQEGAELSVQLKAPEIKSRKAPPRQVALVFEDQTSLGKPYLEPGPRAWVYDRPPEATLIITWGSPPHSTQTLRPDTPLHNSAAVLTFRWG